MIEYDIFVCISASTRLILEHITHSVTQDRITAQFFLSEASENGKSY